MMRIEDGMRSLLICLVVALTGCVAEPPEPLRIGTNVWPGYEPLYLARDLGFLDEDLARLHESPSATEVIRAFRNGSLDAAALTLDEALLLLESGMDVAVVLVMDVSDGADTVIARPGIESVIDLRGRRVGVEATALGAFMLSRALQRAGLVPAEIEVLPMPIDEHLRAWRDGRVDALVTFEPVSGILLDEAAVLLFDSSMIPGEIIDLLVVRRNIVEHAPERVAKVLDAWYRALDHLHAAREDAAERIVRRLGTTPDEFLQSLSGLHFPSREENARFLVGSPPALAETAHRLHDLMRELDLLSEPVDWARLFDAPGVHPP